MLMVSSYVIDVDWYVLIGLHAYSLLRFLLNQVFIFFLLQQGGHLAKDCTNPPSNQTSHSAETCFRCGEVNRHISQGETSR